MQRTQTSQDNSESGTYSCRQAGLDFKNCSKAAAIEEHGVGIQTDQRLGESRDEPAHKRQLLSGHSAGNGVERTSSRRGAGSRGRSWREVGEDGRPRGPACTRASSAGRTMAPRLACNKMPCHSAMLPAPPHCHYCLCPALPTP